MFAPPFSATDFSTHAADFFACSRHKHAHIAHFAGSADAELLARKSHELLHDLEPTLHGFVQLTAASPSMSVAEAIPTLVLQFNGFRPSGAMLVDRLSIMHAFAQLAQHSTELNTFPEVKTAFWTTMAHSFVGNSMLSALCAHSAFFSTPEFPHFVIDCGLQRFTKWSVVDESLCDALFEVFTVPASPAAPVSLGLSFACDEQMGDMTTAQLELLEQTLDRIFSLSDPQHRLTSLDLANNTMNAQQLEVVARIVAKCSNGVYQIKHVNLDSVQSGYAPAETPREYLDITLSAYAVDTLPKFWSFKPSSQELLPRNVISPPVFRSISLRKNFLGHNYFTEYFSTLRYGCRLEEDLSEHLRLSQLPHETSLDMWRWLAFGLFYPRPKRFADQFKLRKLGNLTFGPEAIRTIVNTLRNPVAQLVYNDVDGKDTATTNCLMVCTLRGGANIDVFVSGVEYEVIQGIYQPRQTWTKTLLETSDFEALCEREDGYVCVVVPGAGLGWVSQEFVVCIEREPLDDSRSAHDGLYHATLRLGPCQNHFHELPPLFEAIGRQLRSLAIDYIVKTEDWFPHHNFNTPQAHGVVMDLIRDCCENLQHLQLPHAPAEDVAALLDALANSPLRSRLLTLNVNKSEKSFDQAAIVKLMQIMGDTDNPPALRELRLLTHWIGAEGLASVHAALQRNQTLAIVELTRFRLSRAPANLIDLQSRLDEAFQRQLLRSYSPTDAKLAFLSVVAAETGQTPTDERISARTCLDQSVLETIFSFAASLETRRVIAWHEEFEFRY